MAGKKDKVKDSDRFTILAPSLDKCWVCGSSPVHIHEVLGGPNRDKSKQYGLTLPLCPAHHNMSGTGIHFNKELNEYAIKYAEKMWIDKYAKDKETFEDKTKAFIDVFGKNYLDEEDL